MVIFVNMKAKVKKYLEDYLNTEYLLMEAINKFTEYYDDEDIEKYGNEIDVVLAYEGEEIPGDIDSNCTEDLKRDLKIDLYKNVLIKPEDQEILDFIKEKIRVVYPFYNVWHDNRMKQLKDQQDLMDI